MSLKLLIYALERASLDYARTGSLPALQRSFELLDELRDALNDIEDLLIEEKPERKEA